MNFHFDPQAFLEALPLIGKGMLGVYVVTAVIILVVTVFNLVTNRLSKKDKNK